MQPSGRNQGGYRGERIVITDVLDQLRIAARAAGWSEEMLPAGQGRELCAWTRKSEAGERNVYLSTGIHGDEPAGPLAVLRLVEDNAWPPDVNLWLCPCLNPTGFAKGTRENAEGRDLNRDYRHRHSDEVRAHVEWLRRQPCFDLGLHLHEDWESRGFYLYELNPQRQHSPASAMINAVRPVCPIDMSDLIENRAAAGGIISPNLDPLTRPEWPESFFMVQEGTRLSYTLEAPSDFPLATRVEALCAAVKAAIR